MNGYKKVLIVLACMVIIVFLVLMLKDFKKEDIYKKIKTFFEDEDK